MTRDTERIDRIDRALETGQLDEATVDTLVDVLSPDPSHPWPGLQVIIHLAQHGAVAPELRRHEVPDRLERAIGRALEAVLPMLDIHPYGPTYKLVEIAERELRKERRKHELVSDRLEEESDRKLALEIVERYLETEPAPMFVNRLRRHHPDLLERAGELEQTPLRDHMSETSELAEHLREPPPPPDEAAEQLQSKLRSLEMPPREVRLEALNDSDPDVQLVASAWAAYSGERAGVPTIMRRVVEGSDVAPQLAVIAGHMAPDRARSAFSQFVAEVSWQNPELPEAELTEERIRAILSARAVLPYLEGGLPPIAPEELPDIVPTDELRRIPEVVEQYWHFWSAWTTIASSSTETSTD